MHQETGKQLWNQETTPAGYVCHVSQYVAGASKELAKHRGMKSMQVTHETMLKQSSLVEHWRDAIDEQRCNNVTISAANKEQLSRAI